MLTDGEGEDEDTTLGSVRSKPTAARGRGKAATTTRPSSGPAKKAPATKGRGKKKVVEEEEEEEEEDQDVIMINDDDDEEDDSLFVRSQPARSTTRKPAARTSARAKSPVKKAPSRASKQSTLNFSQPPAQRIQAPSRAAKGKKAVQELVSLSSCAFTSITNGIAIRMRTRSPTTTTTTPSSPHHLLVPLGGDKE